jgi:hypothetical protein
MSSIKRDLLAVPVTICEEGEGGQYGDLMTFSGLLVYRTSFARPPQLEYCAVKLARPGESGWLMARLGR